MATNGKVTFNPDPPWGDRLVWDGNKWVSKYVDQPRGFPILTKRSKVRVFAWSAFFVADAALIIFMAIRIYRLLTRE